jgi:hypothetical protein
MKKVSLGIAKILFSVMFLLSVLWIPSTQANTISATKALLLNSFPSSQPLSGSIDAKLKNGDTYQISVANPVVGEKMVLLVLDGFANPVYNAEIRQKGKGTSSLGFTGVDGILKADVPVGLYGGDKMELYVQKDSRISAVSSWIVYPKGFGKEPSAITMSLLKDGDGISVNWLSDIESGTLEVMETSLFHGVFDKNVMRIYSKGKVIPAIDGIAKRSINSHHVKLVTLKPMTAYVCRIVNGKMTDIQSATSDKSSIIGVSDTFGFITCQTGKKEPFSFAFATDPQSANSAGYKALDTLLNRADMIDPSISFVMLGGDVVDNGSITKQWNSLFSTVGKDFKKKPYMTVPGNHEYYGDKALLNYRGYWEMPTSGPVGFSENSYMFTKGDARFYALDTQGNIDRQLVWLEAEVLKTYSQWNIVVMHRGIYGSFYNEEELRRKIAPVFDRVGIDLVLSGHDHTYERSTVKENRRTEPGMGTTYLVGGCSGEKFYNAKKRDWISVMFDDNDPVLTLINVGKNAMSFLSFHVHDGETVVHDSFTIKKPVR